jgi:radical SAM protein with 4Fe4S-binding SPASM domain
MTADLGIQYFGIVGGEPLMREDLLELIEEVNLFGMRSHLVTKGTLLTQAWASELAKRDALVSVALDAFSPATYDYICGVPGTYEKARKAIETCAKEGIIQGITATLMKDTTNDVFDLLDFSVQMDFERCPVFVLRPVGRGLDVYWEHAVLGAEYERYLHKLFHRIDEATKAKPMDFFVYDPIYFRVLYQHKATETLRRYYPSGKLCGLGRYLDVDAEGNVLACLFTELKVGNIRERTLKEIWEEVTSSSFFSEIHDPANLKGACCSCKYNDICGGCRTRAYKLTGDWFGADPACAYTKKG